MEYTFTIDDTALSLFIDHGKDLQKMIQSYIVAAIQSQRDQVSQQTGQDIMLLDLATQKSLLDQVAVAKAALPPPAPVIEIITPFGPLLG